MVAQRAGSGGFHFNSFQIAVEGDVLCSETKSFFLHMDVVNFNEKQ